MTRAPTLAALTLLLTPLPALAGPAGEACYKSGPTPAERLAACSALIQDASVPAADKVPALNVRADQLLNLDRPKDAIAEANAALALAPGNAVALNLRAEAEDSLGQHAAALADVKASLAADPRNVRALLNLGFVLRGSGATSEAERDAYDKALAVEPDNPYALELRGGWSADAGRWAEALAYLERAHQAAPKDGEILARRGEAYQALGRDSEALADFKAAVKADPENQTALYDLGYLQVDMGDHAGAFATADRLFKLSPETGAGLFIRAAALRAQNKTPETIAVLEDLVKRDPKHGVAHKSLGRLYLETDRPALAETQAAAALALRPDDAEALLLRADVRAAQGDFKAALADDDRAISLLPDFDGYYARSLHRSASGDQKGALADARKAAELDPKSSGAWYGIGHAARELDDTATAVAAADQTLRLSPDDPAAWDLRATLYADARDWAQAAPAYERAGDFLYAAESWYAAGDTVRALKAYDRAVKDDPKSTLAWRERGELLAGQGRYREALKSFDQGLGVAPADARLLVSRSSTRANLKDPAGAKADLDAAAKAEPKAAFVFNARGLDAAGRGQFDEAIGEYDRAITLDPKFADAFYNRALALMEQNHNDRAIRDLNAALGLNPKDAMALALKGEAFRRLGDHARALEVLDAAIALDPDMAVAFWRRSQVQAALGDKIAAEADRARALKLDPTVGQSES